MASIIKCDTIQSTTSNVFFQNSVGTEYARFDSTGVFQLVNPSSFAAGTAAAPSITATGDTNTGIFFPAADTIGFSEGGAECARFDSSGNWGLGVTPSAWNNVFKAVQINAQGCLMATSASMQMGNNIFYDGAYKFIGTGYANRYYQATGQHVWTVSTASGSAGGAITETQAMTLDASGNLGIGTTSPYSTAGYSSFTLNNTTGSQIRMRSNGTDIGLIFNTASAFNVYTSGAIPLVFSTNDTERARITSSGDLFVGATTLDIQLNMLYWNRGGGTAGHLALGNTEATNATSVLYINRQGSDGTLVEFRQANATEGSISVAGTTVTYGGGHLARFGQLPDGSEDPTLLKGTVLTNLDEMCVWINKETGIPADNEQCNKVKISDVDGDANVAGVFVSWSYDEQHDTNDLFVAMTGDMIIRIAQGTTVQRGDLLMSAGDGTAKPQGDDIVRSKTVAKVTSTHVTCTYADGSYCVPCVLMAC